MAKSPKPGLLGSLAIGGAAIAALLAVGFLSYRSWTGLGDVEMSLHGWIAITLGTVVTLAVGGGLMFLVFYSSRKNYDDPGENP